MEYYVLTVDKRYTDAPVVKNWYGKINKDDICVENAYKLQQREVFEISHNPQVVFTDIVTFPFFLVSNIGKKVISMYAPGTGFKQIALLDSKAGKAQSYHLPILPKVPVVESKEKGYMGMVLKDDKLKVRLEDIGNLRIFQVEKADKTYTIAALDLLESLLRRGAKGICACKIEIER